MDISPDTIFDMTSKYHLAQVNIATALAEMDEPLMQGFVERLDPLNALADSMPGFVWRLQTDDGDATAIRVFENPLILFNMSVWESVEALEAFVFNDTHLEAVRQRAKWFKRPTKAVFCLWWIEAGHIPTEEEAKARLELLWRDGPTTDAFTFKQRFPVPVATALGEA